MRSFEQIIVQKMFSNEILGIYVNLREIASLPLYVLGPLLSEKLYIKGSSVSLKYLPLFIFSLFLACGISLYKGHTIFISVALIVMAIFAVAKVVIFVMLEKSNHFVFTWAIKLLVIPLMLIPLSLPDNFTELKNFLIFIIFIYFLQFLFATLKFLWLVRDRKDDIK
jgi:hypothetical protein